MIVQAIIDNVQIHNPHGTIQDNNGILRLEVALGKLEIQVEAFGEHLNTIVVDPNELCKALRALGLEER